MKKKYLMISLAMIILSSCAVNEIPAKHKLCNCIRINDYQYYNYMENKTIETYSPYYVKYYCIGDTIYN